MKRGAEELIKTGKTLLNAIGGMLASSGETALNGNDRAMANNYLIDIAGVEFGSRAQYITALEFRAHNSPASLSSVLERVHERTQALQVQWVMASRTILVNHYGTPALYLAALAEQVEIEKDLRSEDVEELVTTGFGSDNVVNMVRNQQVEKTLYQQEIKKGKAALAVQEIWLEDRIKLYTDLTSNPSIRRCRYFNE